MAESDSKPLDRFVEFVLESTRIFKGAYMAWDPKKLLFALGAVVVWAIGAMLINALIPNYWIFLIVAGLVATLLVFVIFARTDTEVATKGFVLFLVGAILAVWAVVVVLYMAMKNQPSTSLGWVFHPLWALAVASFFGTAMSRIAVVYAAREDSVGFRDAARFALRKLATSLWTLLMPAAAVLGFWLLLACVGVPGRLQWGVGWVWYLFIGLVYIVFLIGGLCFALVLLMYVPGLPLFQSAIAAEGEDAFSAFSNVYGFILQKPWRLAFYGVLAYIYGRVVVSIAAAIVIGAGKIANGGLAWGIGSDMAQNVGKLDLGSIIGTSLLSAEGPGAAAFRHFAGGNVLKTFEGVKFGGGWLIIFWQYVLLALFMAFALTLFYSLATQIYFLMRKAANGTPLTEVYEEAPEEEEFKGEFAQTPKPAEVKKAVLEDVPPPVVNKPEPKEGEDKPIDLAGSDKPLDFDDGPSS